VECKRKLQTLAIVMDQQYVCSVDLSGAPHDIVKVILAHMDLQQRFICALVCSDWAKAAAAATNTIVRPGVKDLTLIQQWLDKHGSQVGTLRLRDCSCTLARLPCAQLQDLLLHSVSRYAKLTLDSRVWRDIAAATKLTSVQLEEVSTTAQQADVVSALSSLPNLEQLTWREVECGQERELSDSRLLQQLTRLTGLELQCVTAKALEVTAEALQHLSLLNKLQRLSTHSPDAWAAADYPGLQQLQGLTGLQLTVRVGSNSRQRFPACVSHLTALQQLEVWWATFPELNALTALTALTKLQVFYLTPGSTPLRLPALQHLDLEGSADGPFHPLLQPSHLASCTQLQCLWLSCFRLTGPGTLVASSMLQHLNLQECSLSSGGGVRAARSPWELLFPGPGQLPHLTALVFQHGSPELQQADVARLVACCSSLQRLELESDGYLEETPTGLTALLPLRCLTGLHLNSVTDEQCSSLAQLTGLRELQVFDPSNMSAAGFRHLASLEQLTSLGFVCGPDNVCGSDDDDANDDEVNSMMLALLSDTVKFCKHGLVNKVRTVF